jgi:hypothetical protein
LTSDYVYALRDLQFAYNESANEEIGGLEIFRQVEARIAKAFRRLAQSHRAMGVPT